MYDSLHPYSYKLCGELTYEFTTKAGVVYVAYFLDMTAYDDLFENVYTFNFDTRVEANIPQDDRIADTICTIIGEIFKNNNNAVVIVCDNTDHREKGRNRLFQQWYTRLHDTAICKVDKQYRSEYYDIYSSLLIHENNPDFDNIVRAFIRLSENGFIPETENEDKNIKSDQESVLR